MNFDEISRRLRETDEFWGRNLEPPDNGPPVPPLSAYEADPDAERSPPSPPGSTAGPSTIQLPTPFEWRDPSTLPPRPWLYGRHLIRGHVSVTVAPGGVGKSSLTNCEGLAMASGRNLLGEWVAGPLNVWIFNLEDPRDELERRIVAAMMHHGIAPDEMDGRLYVDTGRERDLCTAI